MGRQIRIEGGHVIDPRRDVDGPGTVTVEGNRIAEERPAQNGQVIDAQGLYVLPGFIDFHTHLFEGSVFGITPELFPPSGVTAAVDAGTTGVINFNEFYRNTWKTSRIHLKAFLNVSPIRQPGGGVMEPLDPECIQWERLLEMLEQYPDILLGLKIRISRGIVKDLGLKPLEDTFRFAERHGLRVNVHITDPPEPLEEIIPMFRPGDIVCHMYQGSGHTILGEDKSVGRCFWEAKERGVIFDAANGRSNFDYDVAREALAQGFLPDIISTDATALNYNQPEQVKNLPFVMSKYLSLGMKLNQVVRAVTAFPAALMGMEGEIGTLSPGAWADVVICRLREETVRFRDTKGTIHYGNQLLEPVWVMSKGRIVYCRPDFS